jgi:integrase
MASIHRDPRSPNGVWYASYTLAGGRRVFRSTKQRSKSKARLLAEAWEAAEREAAAGMLTRNRAAEIINETLARSGQVLIERISVKEWLPYNPVSGTSAAKSDATRKGTFSPEQIVALLRVAPADWQGAILFSYSTGARLGDTANLQWESLDVANGIVAYREAKTGAQAVIGLHQDFLDWLAERPLPDQPDAFVFPLLAGKPLAGDGGLSATFRKLIAKAGIENPLLRAGNAGLGNRVRALSFHSLRHNAATAVFNNAALKEITRRVTRDAAAGVVDRYIHEDIAAIKAAVNLIPKLPL